MFEIVSRGLFVGIYFSNTHATITPVHHYLQPILQSFDTPIVFGKAKLSWYLEEKFFKSKLMKLEIY